MRESLLAGFSQATDLAELVMQVCDLDYRSAYQVVGTAVRQANRRGLRGVDLTADMLDEAAQEQLGYRLGLVGTDLSDVLDPRSIVLTRVLPGGAAPHVVRRMAAECHAGARRARAEAADRRRRFDLAEEGLVRVVRERVEE
jgi:argininosuccinate lyase